MKLPTVIFQITAIGKNARTLEESARSVLHWIRHTPQLAYRHRLWVIIEPDGFRENRAAYLSLRDAGAEILVVPAEYTTPLGTTGKARALQYAIELRQEQGMSDPDTWVYHQDEETSVGQDTMLGISDFVRERPGLVGVGLILYPLDWTGSPSHVQELTRSYDDLRVLDSMTMPGNPSLGFHGSHILVRADVEDSVGWDTIGYSPAEDLTFEIRVRARYGSVFRVLRGFAYEKGAFSVRDQLRQRRRWVHGVLFAMRRSPELSLGRRLTLLYSMASWFSALPSVILLAASIYLHYGPLLIYTGIFTGFIWVSMVTGYIEGYRLHAAYVRRTVSIPRMVLHGLLGALVDVAAPWYALITQPSLQDFIRKDLPESEPAPPQDVRRRDAPFPGPSVGAKSPAAGALRQGESH